MLFWLMLLLVPAAIFGFGFWLLHYACARRELPEGWEDRRVEKSSNEAWKQAWRAGREWLEHRETEEAEVQSEDGFLLHGVLIPHIAPRATVILFHGWRSSWELDFLCILPFLHSLGLQCLLVDERAQGDSEGRFITFGVRERTDVPVWVEFVANRFGRKHPIFLHGVSMGASVVTMASSYRFDANVRGIVADCGFASPYEVVSSVWRSRTPFPAHFAMWLLDKFARWFAGFGLKEYSAEKALAKAEHPVLFIHGTADRFVPSYMTKQAYEVCRSEKALLLVEGAGHCMSWLTDPEACQAAYRDFIEKHLARN